MTPRELLEAMRAELHGATVEGAADEFDMTEAYELAILVQGDQATVVALDDDGGRTVLLLSAVVMGT